MHNTHKNRDTATLSITGNPEMSEYFLAGLKDGGASMELSAN